ncbi:telomerase reverse transcriptase isoform X2 [Nerophis ophidion]|uniref:telomerase reverse transcriptase isoform X2 n=1 Tax=Nerophis ophidion TaxID=159077 RepID=UPI002AE017D1|nr:telomerase reverse transcriptase isoform X2 [Nerophis ophidion]XP_061738632.1 telomerase reverse transcriptase isoform X2 [Nerophis ophidion]
MSQADFSRVLHTLRCLYGHTCTLEEFADRIVFEDGERAALVQQTDTDRFKTFVQNIFVCYDNELQQVPSRHQVCTFSELLAFILNSLLRKRKRNILARGYNLWRVAQEERDADHLKFQGDVTQCAAYFLSSDLWKKVCARLGTDLTRYLLESCSLFIAVPPSCALQVCGAPVYDRVSMTAVPSGFSLRARSRTQRNAAAVRRRRDIRSEKKRRRDARVHSRKRRREEEEMSASTKRRRVGECDASEVSVEPAGGSWKAAAETSTTLLEGTPSWRSGTSPPLPPSQVFVRTRALMYGGSGMPAFLLNKKKGGRRLQAQDLVRVVFFEGLPYLRGVQRKPKKLPRRFFNMVPLFSQVLREHRRCPYARILQRVCPLLPPQHCAPHRVYLFVRECLSKVVPAALWGSGENRRLFLARVRSFLRSSKFDKVSLAELMWKMKVNHCDWLKLSKTGRVPPSELAYRTRVLGQLLAWLLDGYVVHLVRACFYVTESMGQKYALKFYRHDVWAKLQDLAFRSHVSKGQMVELTPAQVASLPKSTVVSHLRFIPKADSMRPITRLLRADAKTRFFQGHVRDLRDVLRFCVRSSPSLLGSTVWGLTDIHKVLSSLAAAQKKKPHPLFFIKVDVSGAYESLPHAKLLDVIGQVLSTIQDQPFSIRSYAKVWADLHEGLKKSFVRQDNMGATNMKSFVSALQRSYKVHHAILVEQKLSSDIDGKEELEFFKQMLTGSVVRFGKKTYRQCRGIPQGSSVSSLLCCLCYGHMEKGLFQGSERLKGRLMRLVDDFLLITPDLREAHNFLRLLLAGVPQYGLVINPQKVLVNFPSVSLANVRTLPSHSLFPWCGLLLDPHSLSVHNDYSRYAGLSLRYSLTLGSFHSAGEQMRRKLMVVLRLKCHALFLDVEINSLQAVYKNIYKLVLLHAFRFHVCAQSLPFGQTVAKNPFYFLRMIWDLAHYANQLLRRSNKGLRGGCKALAAIIPYDAVKLLFCLSFLLVLSQHRAVYKKMLPQLQKRKRHLERRLGDLKLARVRQAANPRTPVDFLTIKM